MTGNSEAYQQHLNAGHNAAWERDWATAIREYSLARDEAPNDPEAHVNLGLSLLRAERFDEAVRVYDRAHTLAPADPTPLERGSEALERMGRLKDAAQRLILAADAHIALRDLEKAVESWRHATELTPGLVSVHGKLAQAYERMADRKKAVQQYLILAFLFRRGNDLDRATRAVERVLKIDPGNSQALNNLNALRSGGELMLPDGMVDAPTSAIQTSKRIDEGFDFFDDHTAQEALEADPSGPLGEAMNQALNMLAMFVLESGQLDATGADALTGMDMQRQGDIKAAIAAYHKAVLRLPHPALKLSLGGLLLADDNASEAIKHLTDAIQTPELAAGALHGLGQAYVRLGRPREAAKRLVQALEIAEVTRGSTDEEALERTYAALQLALDDANPEILDAVNKNFLKTLTGSDWPIQMVDLRRHLDEMFHTGGAESVRDFLGSGGTDDLADTVRRIDRYIREGRLLLAMDEAHQAIEEAPSYLPVHVRMAEIMVREGRLRQAINKYYMVAQAYMVRDENDRAVMILNEVLEMSPLDTAIRTTLIDLMTNAGRTLETIPHYETLGQTYQQLGNIDSARESYVMAETLARRLNQPVTTIVQLKHKIADLDMARLDTRRAQRYYEEILELVPTDERAQRQIIELLLALNNGTEAISRLDKLLSYLAHKRQADSILKVLSELTRLFPNETGLRSRLGGMLKQLGRKDEAIQQFDALGEIQIKAGMNHEAAATIRQIIRLGPANVEQYQALLNQIERN